MPIPSVCIAALSFLMSQSTSTCQPAAFDPEALAENPVAKTDCGASGMTDTPKTLRISAGPDWIPLKYVKNIEEGSALDFSGMPWFDAPAGKHGRVTVNSGHFEFAHLPGRRQRFLGVNLCQTANFPDHALADEFAERLRRLGFNAVRFHHHDKALAESQDDVWDRFDYFTAALVKRGIYIATDLYISRPVKWRDIGIDRDGEAEKYARRALMTFYEPAYSNWCAFAEAFLSHRNPYTGRTYAEEPAWVCIGLINEGRFIYPFNELPRLEPFQRKWREWIAEKRRRDPGCYPELGAEPSLYPRVEWKDQRDMTLPRACCDFMADLDRAFVTRAKSFIRGELRCHAPLSNNNNSAPYAAMLRVRSDCYDFADAHSYRGGVNTSSFPFKSANENVFKPNGDRFAEDVWFRTLGKPFVISESNFAHPNPLRSGGALKLGTLAAIQDWSAIFHFAYAQKLLHLEEGGFAKSRHDLAIDPLNLASLRIAMALFLRGDLESASETCALVLDDSALRMQHGQYPYPKWGMGSSIYSMRCGVCGFDSVPDGARAFPVMEVVNEDSPPFAPKSTPPVEFDGVLGSLLVSAGRTAAVFAPSGSVSAGVLNVDLGGDAAMVSAISLDGKPLERSGRILFSVLGDVQHEGVAYVDATRLEMTDRGNPARHLVRVQSVKSSLRVDGDGAFRIYALNSAGGRENLIDSRLSEGKLEFIASTRQPFGGCMMYEIVKE